jgi:hypothetical protein
MTIPSFEDCLEKAKGLTGALMLIPRIDMIEFIECAIGLEKANIALAASIAALCEDSSNETTWAEAMMNAARVLGTSLTELQEKHKADRKKWARIMPLVVRPDFHIDPEDP